MSRAAVVASLVDSCDYLNARFVRHLRSERVNTIVELGCRHGWDTLKLRTAFDAEVHAFECNPSALTICRQVLAGQDKVTLTEGAAWNAAGEIDLYPVEATTVQARDYPDIGASSSFPPRDDYREQCRQSHARVQAVRLDDYCRGAGITKIDLLCMNIRGAALQALESAGALLDGVDYVIAELDGGETLPGRSLLDSVRDVLAARGLEVVEHIQRDGRTSGCLFVRAIAAGPIAHIATSTGAGGDDPIVFQVLASTVSIHTALPEVRQRLPYLVQRASQDFAPQQRIALHIDREGTQYVVRAADAVLFDEANVERLLESLFLHVHRAVFECLPDHIRVHAASGFSGGKYFLLVGDAHAGKTTLALRLLLAGFDILGDELILLRDSVAITFPRRFYARGGSFDLIPELRLLDSALPFVSNDQEPRITGLDPSTLGRAWHIRPGRVAAIIYLEPNFGARSALRPCPKTEMVRLVMEQCTPPASGRADWIGDLCRTVDSAETWILKNGEASSAIRAIQHAVQAKRDS